MRPSRASSCLVALALLAGCGDDDDASDGDATDVKATDLRDERTDAEVTADAELADAIVLQRSDLPPGWQVQAIDERRDDPLNEQLLDCVGVSDTAGALNDRAESRQAFRQDFRTVGSSVTVYPDAEYASAVFDIVLDPEFRDCYVEVLRPVLERDLDDAPGEREIELTEVRIDPLVFAELGDEIAPYRLGATAEADGVEVRTFVDLVVFRSGRIVGRVDLSRVGTPFDPEEAEELVRLVVERAEAPA